MLNIINGDITDIDHGIIVHQVNCMGVMGSGLAKAISDKYPMVKEQYTKWCKPAPNGFDTVKPEDFLGDAQFLWQNENLCIVNGFSQIRYGRDGKRYTDYEAVAQVFEQVQEVVDKRKLPVYAPFLYGCGLGGGNWEIVSRIITDACPSVVFVFKGD